MDIFFSFFDFCLNIKDSIFSLYCVEKNMAVCSLVKEKIVIPIPFACAAFPYLYIFGKSIPTQHGVPTHYVRHVLTQYDQRIARDNRHLMLLFNQQQRHAVVRSAKGLFVKNHPKFVNAFTKLVNMEEWRVKVRQASANPKSKEGREIIREISPIMKAIGGAVPHGALQRATNFAALTSTAAIFGAPSYFVTFSPDEVHSGWVIRFGLPKIPLTKSAFEKLMSSIRSGSAVWSPDGEGEEIRITEYNLQYRASRNPAAAALFFEQLVRVVMEYLFGVKIESDVKVTKPSERKGIFGGGRAAVGVVETQARGALHAHFLVWTKVTPSHFQALAQFPTLFARAMDAIVMRIVCTESPVGWHLWHMIQRWHHRSIPHAALFQCPSRLTDPMGNASYHALHMNTMQMHRHVRTCLKGEDLDKPETVVCRLHRPTAVSDSSRAVELFPVFNHITQKIVGVEPREVVPRKVDDEDIRYYLYGDRRELDVVMKRTFFNADELFASLEEEEAGTGGHGSLPSLFSDLRDSDSDVVRHLRDLLLLPTSVVELSGLLLKAGCSPELRAELLQILQSNCTPADAKKRVWKLALSCRNAYLVEFCKALAEVNGCNNNCQMIFGEAGAKAALFYLLKYMNKQDDKLAEVIPLLLHAREHVEKYGSEADDASTELGEARRTAVRLVNEINGKAEVSDCLAAASLIGLPSLLSSNSFVRINVPAAVACVRSKIAVDNQHSVDAAYDDDLSDESDAVVFNGDLDIGGNTVDLAGLADSGSSNPVVVSHGGVMVEKTVSISSEDDVHTLGLQTPYLLSTGEVVVVSLVDRYKYRGPEAAEMNLLEYCCCVRTEKKKKKKKKGGAKSTRKTRGSTHQDGDGGEDEQHYCDDGAHEADNGATGGSSDDGASDNSSDDVDSNDAGPQRRGGREENFRFEFDARCPIAGEYYQTVLSKLQSPMLTGGGLPKLPSYEVNEEHRRKWERVADNFGAYVVTLLCPWDLENLVPKFELSWNGLTHLIQYLRQQVADEADVDKVTTARTRLGIMKNLGSMSISSDSLLLHSKFRSQNADHVMIQKDPMTEFEELVAFSGGSRTEVVVPMGHDDSRGEGDAFVHSVMDVLPQEIADAIEDVSTQVNKLMAETGARKDDSNRQLKQHLNRIKHAKNTLEAFTRTLANDPLVFRGDAVVSGDGSGVAVNTCNTVPQSLLRKEAFLEESWRGVDVLQKLKEMQSHARVDGARSDDDHAQSSSANNSEFFASICDEARMKTFCSSVLGDVKPNSSQMHLLLKICRKMADTIAALQFGSDSPEPIRWIVQGSPGVGKSFLVQCIVKCVNALNDRIQNDQFAARVQCAAYTGVACTSLPQGRTVHNLFHFPIFSRNKQSRSDISSSAASSDKLVRARMRSDFDGVRLLIIDEVSLDGEVVFLFLPLAEKKILVMQKWRRDSEIDLCFHVFCRYP